MLLQWKCNLIHFNVTYKFAYKILQQFCEKTTNKSSHEVTSKLIEYIFNIKHESKFISEIEQWGEMFECFLFVLGFFLIMPRKKKVACLPFHEENHRLVDIYIYII